MEKKKLLLIVAIAGLMVACKSNTRRQVADQVEAVVTTVQNHRNIQGIYKGTLPTASGSGMEVSIVLSDNDNFRKTYYYLEEGATTYESSGKFVLNADGSVITLEGEELPNQYLVGDDLLTQLDTEGNPITGNLADHYILRKAL